MADFGTLGSVTTTRSAAHAYADSSQHALQARRNGANQQSVSETKPDDEHANRIRRLLADHDIDATTSIDSATLADTGTVSRSNHSNGPAATPDAADLGGVDAIVDRMMALPEVRSDLVARVRAEIAAGTYDTPDKVSAAVDTMLVEEESLRPTAE